MRHSQLVSSEPSSQAGFTLTELLVVMVVLSLIAAAITPQVMGRLDRSKVRAAKLQLQTLSTSLDMYKIDTGSYPSDQEGLQALITRPNSAQVWDGPYVKTGRSVFDSWDNPIEYKTSGSSYRLLSLGADGVTGGAKHDADISFPDFSETQTAGN